jgi:hypothetical protein
MQQINDVWVQFWIVAMLSVTAFCMAVLLRELSSNRTMQWVGRFAGIVAFMIWPVYSWSTLERCYRAQGVRAVPAVEMVWRHASIRQTE